MKKTHKNSHNDLTAEYVRDVLTYSPETGELHWRKALSKRCSVGHKAGFVNRGAQKSPRIKIGIGGKDYMAHRVIWLWMTGEWPTYEIDHINEDATDNRWENLRAATPSQNHRNRGAQRNNTAGYKGVAFDKRRGKWIAGVKLYGKRHNLGTFDTPEDAYKAYCEAAEKLHGSFVNKGHP